MSLKLGILTASIKEARVGPTISNWLFEEISLLKLKDVSLEIVDLKDYPMPFVGIKPNDSELKTIDAWKDKISSLDGFVLVTPEYNRMIPGALANAFQYLVSKLSNKTLAFVGYGFLGASLAITNFRATLNYQNVLVIQKEINISFNVDFKDASTKDMKFTAGDWHNKEISELTMQLVKLTKALKH